MLEAELSLVQLLLQVFIDDCVPDARIIALHEKDTISGLLEFM